MSTSLALPESKDLARNLPSEVLYQLETAGQIATEILDERVVGWTEEGKTQQWIAEELGCERSSVSYRQKRLGVQPASNRGRPRNAIVNDSQFDSDAEVVDGEVVEEPGDPAHYLPDVLEGADGDLREQVVVWCAQGRRVDELIEDGCSITPRFDGDREALLKGLLALEATTKKVKEALA